MKTKMKKEKSMMIKGDENHQKRQQSQDGGQEKKKKSMNKGDQNQQEREQEAERVTANVDEVPVTPLRLPNVQDGDLATGPIEWRCHHDPAFYRGLTRRELCYIHVSLWTVRALFFCTVVMYTMSCLALWRDLGMYWPFQSFDLSPNVRYCLKSRNFATTINSTTKSIKHTMTEQLDKLEHERPVCVFFVSLQFVVLLLVIIYVVNMGLMPKCWACLVKRLNWFSFLSLLIIVPVVYVANWFPIKYLKKSACLRSSAYSYLADTNWRLFMFFNTLACFMALIINLHGDYRDRLCQARAKRIRAREEKAERGDAPSSLC